MARYVVFLGDLLHAKAGRSEEMFETLAGWRAAHPDIELALVRGNHDRRAGDPPSELGVECFDAPHVIAPFALAHHPAASDAGFVLSGHVHPGVRLYGRGGQRERLPCFVFARDWAILPAFGDFTGLADAEPGADCDVYAIADDAVIRVTSRA
jgi:DNA ligase-associated metallophosphoesterase